MLKKRLSSTANTNGTSTVPPLAIYANSEVDKYLAQIVEQEMKERGRLWERQVTVLAFTRYPNSSTALFEKQETLTQVQLQMNNEDKYDENAMRVLVNGVAIAEISQTDTLRIRMRFQRYGQPCQVTVRKVLKGIVSLDFAFKKDCTVADILPLPLAKVFQERKKALERSRQIASADHVEDIEKSEGYSSEYASADEGDEEDQQQKQLEKDEEKRKKRKRTSAK